MERIITIEKWKAHNESENKGTIYFRNFTQKCLWDNELSGQVSDGHWENSRNSNWEFWCSLNTAVDEANPRVEARTSGKVEFGLANSMLLDIVGDRMLAMAKMSKVTTDENVVKAAEYLEGINSEEELENALKTASPYYQEKYKLIPDSDFKKMLTVPYTKANMISDLKDMSAIMKTANGSALVSKVPKASSITSTGSEDKDTARIEGIIAKAKGDKDKEVQLATNMANAITDREKATRRGKAAEQLNFHNIAKIFLDRARVL